MEASKVPVNVTDNDEKFVDVLVLVLIDIGVAMVGISTRFYHIGCVYGILNL